MSASTELLTEIDWLALPPDAQDAIRRPGPLTVDRHSRRVQAGMLGVSEATVAADEQRIREPSRRSYSSGSTPDGIPLQGARRPRIPVGAGDTSRRRQHGQARLASGIAPREAAGDSLARSQAHTPTHPSWSRRVRTRS